MFFQERTTCAGIANDLNLNFEYPIIYLPSYFGYIFLMMKGQDIHKNAITFDEEWSTYPWIIK